MRLYADGTLRTTGEIQITGSKVINFGYDQTKADGATGRIGYGPYEANSLNIVGGSITGERKMTCTISRVVLSIVRRIWRASGWWES